jgi:hypothetical protein
MRDLLFSRWWLWRLLLSGMLCLIIRLTVTEVSEENSASIFSVEKSHTMFIYFFVSSPSSNGRAQTFICFTPTFTWSSDISSSSRVVFKNWLPYYSFMDMYKGYVRFSLAKFILYLLENTRTYLISFCISAPSNFTNKKNIYEYHVITWLDHVEIEECIELTGHLQLWQP